MLQNQSLEELNKFFDFMKCIDTSGKIKSTMSVPKGSILLDLSLLINEQNKICVDLYAKATNSFTYVLPSYSDEKFDTKNKY